VVEEGPTPVGYLSKTQMSTIAEFVKTTLIGGIIIVLPVYIAVLLILKAVQRAFGCGEADHGCNPRFRGV
jgi:hypothetical protein